MKINKYLAIISLYVPINIGWWCFYLCRNIDVLREPWWFCPTIITVFIVVFTLTVTSICFIMEAFDEGNNEET